MANWLGGFSTYLTVDYWRPDEKKIQEQAKIQAKCKTIENVSQVTLGLFLVLTTVGVASVPFVPFKGILTVLGCGTAALLSRDVKLLSQFVKNDSNVVTFLTIKNDLFRDKIETLDPKTLMELSYSITDFVDQASKPLSPLGGTIVDFLKESTVALLQIRAGHVDKNLVSSLLSWWSSKNIDIPNFDYIREGMIHASRAVHDLSLLSAAFCGSAIMVGCAGLAFKSAVPGLLLYLAALSWIKHSYEMTRVGFIALALVGTAFLYLKGATLASIGVVVVGAVGVLLSYDFSQLASNIITVANNDELKNTTAIFSGVGIVGFAKTVWYYLPQISHLFSQGNSDETVDIEQNIKQIFAHLDTTLKKNLTSGMTPVGAFLVTRIFNKMKDNLHKK